MPVMRRENGRKRGIMRQYATNRGYAESFMTERQQVIAAMYRLKAYCKRRQCKNCTFYAERQCKLNEKPAKWDCEVTE